MKLIKVIKKINLILKTKVIIMKLIKVILIKLILEKMMIKFYIKIKVWIRNKTKNKITIKLKNSKMKKIT